MSGADDAGRLAKAEPGMPYNQGKMKTRVNAQMKNPKDRLILAVDVGGTKVEAGLVSARGKVVAAERRPMAADGNAADGLRSVQTAIDAVLLRGGGHRVTAIGVCVPGWLDAKRGKVLLAANLPCWRNYSLAAKLLGIYGRPVRLENDANAAARAEAEWGAGRDYQRFFYVSLGTGLGTCMAYRTEDGWHFPPSEGGHMTINYNGPLCPCGKRGCIEMYVSGKAIARQAKARLSGAGARVGPLKSMVAKDLGDLDTQMIVKAAKRGDKLSQEVIETAVDLLAVWLGNVLEILEPGAFVFGGGLGGLFASYRARIERGLKEGANRPGGRRVRILKAKFGSQSALLGAAALWLQNPPK
ncbi:MAG TPA: ROK family protein [Candidatus Acidoferrales bacterium]